MISRYLATVCRWFFDKIASTDRLAILGQLKLMSLQGSADIQMLILSKSRPTWVLQQKVVIQPKIQPKLVKMSADSHPIFTIFGNVTVALYVYMYITITTNILPREKLRYLMVVEVCIL